MQATWIFVNKDLAPRKSSQKCISLEMVAPNEVQVLSRRHHRRIPSQIADVTRRISPGLEKENLPAMSGLAHCPRKVSPPVAGITLFCYEGQTPDDLENDSERPQATRKSSTIVIDPSADIDNSQNQEWEVGKQVARTRTTRTGWIEGVNPDVHQE